MLTLGVINPHHSGTGNRALGGSTVAKSGWTEDIFMIKYLTRLEWLTKPATV